MKLSFRLDLAAKIHEDISGYSSLAATIREGAELARRVEDATQRVVGDGISYDVSVAGTGIPNGTRVRIVPDQGEGP